MGDTKSGDAIVVGQVVEYRPPVTGGLVVGVVTGIVDSIVGLAVTFRVTDGTRIYPTGSEHTVLSEDVS